MPGGRHSRSEAVDRGLDASHAPMRMERSCFPCFPLLLFIFLPSFSNPRVDHLKDWKLYDIDKKGGIDNYKISFHYMQWVEWHICTENAILAGECSHRKNIRTIAVELGVWDMKVLPASSWRRRGASGAIDFDKWEKQKILVDEKGTDRYCRLWSAERVSDCHWRFYDCRKWMCRRTWNGWIPFHVSGIRSPSSKKMCVILVLPRKSHWL